MGKVELSIIIPVYNVEKYIKKCIESILSQVYNHYEIILVDDGSTDSSGKICDYFSERFEFIKTIHKKNEGVSKARNIGLDVAKGIYVMFIDGDDELEENILDYLITVISKNKVDIVECDYNELYETKKVPIGKNNKEKTEYNNTNDIILNFLNKKISIGIWNKVFTREVIDKIRFNEKISHYEDKLFLFEVLRNSRNFIHININGYNYRKREGSASNNKFQYSYLEIKDVDDIIVNNAKEYSQHIYIYAQKNRLETYLMLIKMITISKKIRRYKKEYIELIKQVKKTNKTIIKLLNLKRKLEVFLIKHFKFLYIIIYRAYEIIKT